MKKYKYNIALLLILMLFLPLFMVSCDEETLVVETPDQLFRPALFTANVNGNEVTLTWVPIANASYSLEVSKDSLLFQNELLVIPLEEVQTYKITDLWSTTRYSARIKAVSKDPLIKDSGYNQITFVTGTENILYTPASADISTTSVLLKWDASKAVTKIVVSATGIADRTINLASADIAAGQKLIDGLSSGITYIFKIYNGEMLRGTISVKTK